MKKYLLILPMLAALVACKKDFPELPPATDKGLNTFGCLVNGELIIPYDKEIFKKVDPPVATYDSYNKMVSITAYGQNRQEFRFNIFNPDSIVGKTVPIDSVMYFPIIIESSEYYGGGKIGKLTLIRFDAGHKIVSGTFEFTGVRRRVSDRQVVNPADSLRVTQGRFDITMGAF